MMKISGRAGGGQIVHGNHLLDHSNGKRGKRGTFKGDKLNK